MKGQYVPEYLVMKKCIENQEKLNLVLCNTRFSFCKVSQTHVAGTESKTAVAFSNIENFAQLIYFGPIGLLNKIGIKQLCKLSVIVTFVTKIRHGILFIKKKSTLNNV